jgi:hypothetical protein
MDYRLELLNDNKFEDLVNTICQEILGIGSITFATGKDGGRDGKFTGTAQNFPDTINPWSGKFIIQAKHTENPISSCSENDFGKIIEAEIEKIIELKKKNDIDCYLLFTNRKYTGVKGEALLKRIITVTGIINCVIIGKETLNKQFLVPNKKIVKQYQLDKHHIPFDFSDEEIRDIILAFKSQIHLIQDDLKNKINILKYDFDRIKLSEKNIKNGLSEEFYRNEILARSLMDFQKINSFLNNPINEEIKDVYFDIAAELSQMITLRRDEFNAFEEIFIFIYQLCNDDSKLKGSKRHISTLLHFMYFECLIGIK